MTCINVCLVAWYTIIGVFKAIYYSWRVNANNRMHVDQLKNIGMTKLQTHTLQAKATFCLKLQLSTNHMLHKTRTLEIGVKMPSIIRDFLLESNIVNIQLSLNKVSPSRLNRIQNKSFPEYSIKSQGDYFA